MRREAPLAVVACMAIGLAWLSLQADKGSGQTVNKAVNDATKAPSPSVDRSPADLVVGPGESWLVTANSTSGTASLVSLKHDDAANGAVAAKLVGEVRVGDAPMHVALLPDGKHVLVSASRSGTVTLLEVVADHLKPVATIRVGADPRAIAVAADGRTAYVTLAAEDKVAVVDLAKREKVADIAVGRWPRQLCLSADGGRLAVGCSGSMGVWMIDTATRQVLFEKTFGGLNIGQMAISHDGREVVFPWTFYGQRETSPGSIRQGWVMASRLGAVAFDESNDPRGLSLDPRRNAVADGQGFAVSTDGSTSIVAAGGTHELLLLRGELPWIGIGGSEHMDERLARDANRFTRIALGGRPTAVRLSGDGKRAFVANALKNSIQIVNLDERRVAMEIALGGPAEPSTAERRGEALFHDAARSLENWYSCHTCHYEGGPNAETIDTFNDGTTGTYKTVPPLYGVSATGPWTWHGWQKDLGDAVAKSFTTTMRGENPSERDVADVLAYMRTLQPPPNPHRTAGTLSEAATRGKAVFHSDKAGCANCHRGEHFTDGEIHDVGLGKPSDRYQGFNTPSLIGLHQRARLLHDGRVRTIEKLLTGPHSPQKVTEQGALSDAERADLIAYLLTL